MEFDGQAEVVLRGGEEGFTKHSTVSRQLAFVAALDPALRTPEVGHPEAHTQNAWAATRHDLLSHTCAIGLKRQQRRRANRHAESLCADCGQVYRHCVAEAHL